jgi:mannosidase alpha-like ER degradation enhancer 2
MPYGTVNLRCGVPQGETPIVATAGAGTFLIEFGLLSRFTGDWETVGDALFTLKN